MMGNMVFQGQGVVVFYQYVFVGNVMFGLFIGYIYRVIESRIGVIVVGIEQVKYFFCKV